MTYQVNVCQCNRSKPMAINPYGTAQHKSRGFEKMFVANLGRAKI